MRSLCASPHLGRNVVLLAGLLCLSSPLSSISSAVAGGVGGDLGIILGIVRDAASGEPIEGVHVFLGGPGEPQSTTSGPDGLFGFDGLEAGVYVLEIDELEGYDLGEGPERPSRKVVELAAGATEEVVFELEPLGEALGSIFGVVKNAETGAFLSGVEVILGGPAAPEPQSDETGSEGGFEFVDLGDGVYVLEIDELPGFELGEGPHRPSRKVVELPSGAHREVVFEFEPLELPTAAIVGVLKNSETGDPIPGAEIHLVGPELEEGRVAETGSNGGFEFGELFSGLYVIEIEVAEGFELGEGPDRPSRKVVELDPGQVLQLECELAPIGPPHGRIIGRVRNDVTEEPLPGATVYAIGPNDSGHVRVTETDFEGFFRFEGLAGGAYVIEVEKEGFEAGRGELVVPENGLEDILIDLQPIHPEPGVIFGHVVDASSGNPIPGAKVFYHRFPDDPAMADERSHDSESILEVPDERPFVETNEEGFYSIDDLPPGHYHLLADKEGFNEEVETVWLEPGHEEEVDFELDPRVPGTGIVFGRVFDAETGDPLAGALVSIRPSEDAMTFDAGPAVVFASGETNAEGGFEFPGIPTGLVSVVAEKAGYRMGHRIAEVHSGEETEVNLELQPIPVLDKGHIVGRVRDAETGEGIGGALVVVIPNSPFNFTFSMPVAFYGIAFTNGEGEFSFERVPIGGYQLLAAAEGYLPAFENAVVEAGEVSEVHFLLFPAEPPRFGRIEGFVTDSATGDPIPEAWVRLSNGNDHDWLSHSDHWTTRTNEEGYYQFLEIKADDYRIKARKRGYHPENKTVVVMGDETTECNFELDPVLAFGAIEGYVFDRLEGNPLPEALVFLPPSDEEHHVAHEHNSLFDFTDSEGFYRIEEAPAGNHTVVALHREYFPDAQRAQVHPGETTGLDFGLLPRPGQPQDWEIEILDKDTLEPIEEAKIHCPITRWLYPGASFNLWSGITGAIGKSPIAGIPFGDWGVVATAEGYFPTLLPLVENGSKGVGGPRTMTILLDGAPVTSAAVEDWALY